MRFAFAVAAIVGVMGVLTTAGAAAAVEPGVYVDPRSPAGKEYAFPLDVTRAAALGRDAVRGVNQPLFAAGITPARVGPAGSRGSTKSGASAPTSRHSRGGSATARRAPEAATLIALSRPRSTTVPVALISLSLVLAGVMVGVVIALAARRRG